MYVSSINKNLTSPVVSCFVRLLYVFDLHFKVSFLPVRKIAPACLSIIILQHCMVSLTRCSCYLCASTGSKEKEQGRLPMENILAINGKFCLSETAVIWTTLAQHIDILHLLG